MSNKIAKIKSLFALHLEQIATNKTLIGPKRKGNITEDQFQELLSLILFINDQLDHYNINHNYDFRLLSAIDGSEAQLSKPSCISPADYTFSFLHYLAIQDDKPNAEKLLDLILCYLKKHAKYLSLKDLQILASGSTRAVTNVRFALNELRKFHLVESRAPNNDRSLNPTLLGMLTLIFYRLNTPHILNDADILPLGLKIDKRKFFIWQVPWLAAKSPDKLIVLLDKFLSSATVSLDVEDLKNIIYQFYLLLEDFIYIDEIKGEINVRKGFTSAFINFISSEPYSSNQLAIAGFLRKSYYNYKPS